MEGTETDANAASGSALSSGSLANVAFGALQSGVRYIVLVYTADTSGNVSAPASVAVTS